MRSRWKGIPALVVFLQALVLPAYADLAGYVARAEPEYRWSKGMVTQEGAVQVAEINLRSQVWRGIPWDHQIQVFRPGQVKYPRTAILLITGGSPGPEEIQLGTLAATALGAPVAVLYQIPNQPLFDGLKEDDLIAHTFSHYLESGDDTWPLLFPMTKSAVKAMDAVQAFSEQEWKERIEDFVVTGASKRGWTTYLTAAVDRRVRAIAPMVFDNLNADAQMPHQLKLWGKYSEQIEEYSRRGIQAQLATERGKRLVRMVDPWSYRERLKMPKLLIHGANDRYWATDATRLYWDGLRGETRLLAVPNSGHGLEDRFRVLATLIAFFRTVAEGQTLPAVKDRTEVRDGRVKAKVLVDGKPKAVRLWVARSDNLDFRAAHWESRPMQPDGDAFTAEVEVPERGGVAWFAEAEFAGDAGSYNLCTPPRLAPEP